jgi:hypothetical protein
MTTLSFDELEEKLLSLAERQEALEGSDDQEAIAALWAEWDALEGELAAKADRALGLREELEGRAKQRREQAKRIGALAKADSTAADRLEQLVFRALCAAGITTLETPLYRATVAKNGGQPKLVRDTSISDEELLALLPEDLVETRREPNLERIRAVLELEEEVPGFTLAPIGSHLRVS